MITYEKKIFSIGNIQRNILPFDLDDFDDISRRTFDRSFGVSSFILTELFFHIITIIIIYDTVITINGTR